MKFNKVRLLMFSFILFLGILSGCSSSSSSTGDNEGSDGSNSTNGDTIAIGAIFPLTGAGATYGEMYKQGVDLAIEEINAAGGVNGKPLSVIYEDGRAEPKTSVQAIQTLAAKDIPFVLSAYTGVTLGILPTAERNKITVINGGGQGDELAGASPFLFNTIPLLGLEVEVLVKYLTEEKPELKNAYVIHVDDDSGRSGLNKFTEEFAKNGGEILGSGSHKFGETNFRAILTKAKASNPDLLYIASHGQDAKLVIDQAKELGIQSQIVNTSWTVIPEIVTNPNGQGIIHTSIAFNPAEEWLAKYKEKYGTDQVSSYVSNYYDAVKIFAQAYEYAIENGLGEDGEAIANAIKEIKEFESANGIITFNDDGTSIRQIDVSEIVDNQSNLIKSY
ncbi:ABC transporter substrate-binding protein [Bacillus dakarensis]|uniref:ABC transporter substrate-binding protein n=1 Tax=Robertmurraya dakarensis TaxID=1926278 RepID=UPI000981A2BF|nr:ABC transporter substrate-binding protein [Bacillus dakarensis]